MLIKAVVKETENENVDSGYGLVAGSFEHENRSSGSIKCGIYLD